MNEPLDGPRSDVREEGERLVRAAAGRGLTVRLIGGAAVAYLCPSARRAPLARAYKDVDLVACRRDRKAVAELLEALGYESSDEFNILQGAGRLLFHDPVNDRQLDVILERFEMCHSLDLAGRLVNCDLALDPTDVLLTKLQVRETNERDLKDATALLLDCDIDAGRVAEVLGADWGWWRTATEVLDRVEAYADVLAQGERERVRGRIATLRREIQQAPKGARWRARAAIGERVRWYDEPEDDY